jgi:hypothetical protein
MVQINPWRKGCNAMVKTQDLVAVRLAAGVFQQLVDNVVV